MASQDFINLMTKLYKERYDILSINTVGRRVGDGFSLDTTVALEKNGFGKTSNHLNGILSNMSLGLDRPPILLETIVLSV